MNDLLQKYGGSTALKKLMVAFYDHVCRELGVKHYFFNITIQNLIQDQLNFMSFVMRRSENSYRERPMQSAASDINVKSAVFEDVQKILEMQLKHMGVHFRDIPRMAAHIIEVVEETRDRANDRVKTSINAPIVSLDSITQVLSKKGVITRVEPNGDLLLSSGFSLSYPFCLQVDKATQKLIFKARAEAKGGVRVTEVQQVVDTVRNKYPFLAYEVNTEAEVPCMTHRYVADYKGDGIPVRMLLKLAKQFSWNFDEAMLCDTHKVLVNVVTGE